MALQYSCSTKEVLQMVTDRRTTQSSFHLRYASKYEVSYRMHRKESYEIVYIIAFSRNDIAGYHCKKHAEGGFALWLLQYSPRILGSYIGNEYAFTCYGC